jgi:hypothetical protein
MLSSESGENRRAYEIVVRGEFGDLFAAAFADLTIHPANGQTVLTASVADTAEFYGIVDRLRDFGIEIVRLSQREPSLPPTARFPPCRENQGDRS